MRRTLLAALLVVTLATPSFAVNVYLKEGGIIQAKRVWREGGRVYVLANRDTLTWFEPSEINLKRTFIKRHHTAKKVAAVQPQAQTAAATPGGAAAEQKTPDKKPGVALPAMPKLPEKSPESLAPNSGAGGTIRKQKKEMAEKLGD